MVVRMRFGSYLIHIHDNHEIKMLKVLGLHGHNSNKEVFEY
jgi:hypothetical protein